MEEGGISRVNWFEAAALLVQNNSPLSNEIVGSNQAPQPEVIFLPAT